MFERRANPSIVGLLLCMGSGSLGILRRAMSQESVETLKAVYAKWAMGDFWTPDVFHPDVELV